MLFQPAPHGIELRCITAPFGFIQAPGHVSFADGQEKMHAISGENGPWGSTLIKLIPSA